MRKVSVYKCPVCGMRFKSLSGWGEHIERLHPDTIPDGYSVARYFYYVDTGKTHGSCVQCHKPTEWNETTGKYSRYCSDPNCKKKYCAEAKKRMVDKYGVPHLLNDPDQQRKMLASKSKPYKFRDGGSVLYLSSYEKDFLMTCEFVLGLKSKDIMGPSPHTYTYMYEGKQHFYIPDFYIPDLNLEIEIKDGNDNPNNLPHIVEHDRHTEKIKDEVMIKNPKVNYFKVVNKEYQDFYRFLLECKLAIDDDMVKRVEMELLPATEAVSAKAISELETPQHVYDFIKKNVSYAEFDKLMTPNEVLQKGKGSCHDQAQLAKELLGKIGKNVALHFFIALRPNDPVGGNTHTFVTYKEDNKIVWFETSWDGANGIRKYDNMNQLKSDLFKYHMKTSYGKKYPELEFEFVGNKVKPGMNLGEYVNALMGEAATESAFINHKDEYFNIDKWQRKKGQNVLYIAGLSGSGKSTLGRDISKKYNATYIELDRIASDWWYEDEKFNPNGYQGNVTALLKEIFKDEDPREEFKTVLDRSIMRKRRYSKLYEYCFKHPDQLFIFEGVQVAGYFDIDFLVDKPVIIKNTSRNTSFKRMSIRDRETWNNHEDYLNMKANYRADDRNLDSLRKLMRTNAEKSPVLESSASSVIWDIFHADEVEEASIFEHVPQPATESALTSKERTDFGLPDIKKYPMPDAEHVMLAIKFFNYVNEDREKELADAINAKITEFGITDINIGENNRFGKYYKPAEDSVMTGWAPNVPYSGIVVKESAMPEFVYEPIKFNDRLWQSYQGKRYYPLYIGLMKNISPLGTVIRSYTKENWSHSFISFDPSMGECFTFGNKVIKKGIINARGFGAGIESFNPKANHFSYPPSTEYALHVMFFEESQIKAVKNTVDNIFAHREKYRYNVGGLINYIFNNPKTDPENLFCSQFVALVINSGKQGILDRDPSLYSPGSLADLRGVFYVCNGTIKTYDKLKAEIRTKDIFDDIIKTQNIEALEHSSLTYNADWEDSEDIELAGGYMVP